MKRFAQAAVWLCIGLGWAGRTEADVMLDRPIPEVLLTDAQLGEVLEFHREMTGKKLLVDFATLEVAGVTKTTPISLHLRAVKEETFLRLVLWEAGGDKLDFVIDVEEGLIRVSTAGKLGLVTPRNSPAATERDGEQAKRLLHTPLKWRQDEDPILNHIRDDRGKQSGDAGDRRESPHTRQAAAQQLGPVSFMEAISFIRELQKPVNFWVDQRALNGAGITPALNLSIRIPDVATRAEVLDLLFDAARPKAALDCGVIDNVVIISTKDGLDLLRRAAARERVKPATRPN